MTFESTDANRPRLFFCTNFLENKIFHRFPSLKGNQFISERSIHRVGKASSTLGELPLDSVKHQEILVEAKAIANRLATPKLGLWLLVWSTRKHYEYAPD